MPSAWFLPVMIGLQALWWIVPGMAVALWLHNRKTFSTLYVVPVAVIASAVVSYGAFWAYLLGNGLGQAYTAVAGIASLLLLVRGLRSKPIHLMLRQLDVAVPLLLWLSVSLLYLGITFGCSTARPVTQSDQSCHVHGITFDNLLPQIFADNVYERHPKQLIGDWQGSARPPLQSGAVLLQAPLTLSPLTGITGYQVLATLLQTLWIPAAWVLGRRLKLSGGQLAAMLLFLTCTGFFFFNSVFTWPKLLAASLTIFAFALLFFEKPSRVRWALAGAGLGCAFLAHGGVVFTLIPMAALLVWRHVRKRPGLLATVAAVFILLALPWMLYQKVYDPPGDRLLKWHVGGVVAVDKRPALQLIADSYEKAGPGGVLHNKASNVRTVFGDIPPEGLLYGQGVLAEVRDGEFRYVLFSLGLLNAGWIILLAPGLRRRLKQTSLDGEYLQLMLGVALASLLTWALMLFGPDITVVHQGSYATMMLLFVSLAAVVVSILKPLWLKLLLTLQVTYFILVWVLSVWTQHSREYGYVLWALAGAVAVIVCLYNLKKKTFETSHGASHQSE
jgi:hypothetical protein